MFRFYPHRHGEMIPTLLIAIGLTSKFFLPTRTIDAMISNLESGRSPGRRKQKEMQMVGGNGSQECSCGEMGTREENQVNVWSLKQAHLRSGVFASGCFREGLDTAYTGRDPTPDLKRGSAK